MFFAMYAESLDYQCGTQFVEVRNDLVVRQLTKFGDHLFWATPKAHKHEQHMFTDQPEWLGGFGADDLRAVERAEYEELWRRAGGPSEGAELDNDK